MENQNVEDNEEHSNNIVIDIIPNDDLENNNNIINLDDTLIDTNIRTNENNYSLKDTLKKMRKYRWLHKSTSEYFEKWHSIVITPTILLSAVTTVLSVASINPLILSAIAGLSTTLLGVSTYLKLDSKYMNHLIAAEGYDNLVTMIDFEIKFPDEDIKRFAASIEKKILEIKKTTHFLPPEFIYNKYLDKKTLIEGNGHYTNNS